MSDSFHVNLSAFGGAKASVDKAAQHYDALRNELRGNVGSLREGKVFSGGFGITGHFQDSLNDFGQAWTDTMDEFAVEERAFVTFLQGFSVRLADTHDLYRDTDTRGAGAFDDIARWFDRERP
jgi:uncharacterized protein YukE